MYLNLQKTLKSKNSVNSTITGYKINLTIINNCVKTTNLKLLLKEQHVYNERWHANELICFIYIKILIKIKI